MDLVAEVPRLPGNVVVDILACLPAATLRLLARSADPAIRTLAVRQMYTHVVATNKPACYASRRHHLPWDVLRQAIEAGTPPPAHIRRLTLQSLAAVRLLAASAYTRHITEVWVKVRGVTAQELVAEWGQVPLRRLQLLMDIGAAELVRPAPTLPEGLRELQLLLLYPGDVSLADLVLPQSLRVLVVSGGSIATSAQLCLFPPRLATLVLSDTRLSSLDGLAPVLPPMLQELNVCSTLITRLPQLPLPPRLRTLNMGDVFAPVTRLGPGLGSQLVDLTVRATREAVGLLAHHTPKSLESLAITVEGGAEGLLLSMPLAHLTTLSLAGCAGALWQSLHLPPTLESLRITNNRLSLLPPLRHLSRLYRLDASYNLLGNEAVDGLPPSLRHLDLSLNDLAMVPPSMATCTALASLLLASNRLCLAKVDQAVFPPSLCQLDLSNNGLVRLRRYSQPTEQSSVCIDLSRLAITRLNLAGCGIASPMFLSLPPALLALNMSANPLTHLPRLPPLLQELDVSMCSLQERVVLPNARYLNWGHQQGAAEVVAPWLDTVEGSAAGVATKGDHSPWTPSGPAHVSVTGALQHRPGI